MREIVRLIWNEWNVAHIARHGIVPQEVEEACHDTPIEREGYNQRIIVLGATQQDRLLAVILQPEPEQGVYYPVTAFPASRKSRKQYREEMQEKGGEAA